MTNKNIYESLGSLDPALIEKAAPAEEVQFAAPKKADRKKNAWVKWLTVAACACLVISGSVLLGGLFSEDSPNDDIVSGFVITAYAENGELTELGAENRVLNVLSSSVGQNNQGNIFGVNMPLFHFKVRPSGAIESNETLFAKYELSVSYNGKIVEGTDEHVMVACSTYAQGFEGESAFLVMGWFEDPTDITISILEKESREIVQTLYVNVSYMPHKNAYELRYVDLNTLIKNQEQAVKASDALTRYFLSQGYVPDYPAYYGGCYIENNRLHVRLVAPTDQEMSEISLVLDLYKNVVVYHYGEYSMSDLQAYADQTVDKMIALGYRVTEWCVSDRTGDVVIAVLEEDFDAAVAWAADALEDYPKVVIEIGDYVIPE